MEQILDLGALTPGLIIVDGKIVDVVDKIVVRTTAGTTLHIDVFVGEKCVTSEVVNMTLGDTLNISSNWRESL